MKLQSKKMLWKPEEDLILKSYVEAHGEGKWATVSKRSGLMRGGKSCRLRWKNYLRPNIKHGGMSKEEEDIIIRMHNLIGNRWSLIAGRLPGRTDNEVKNYWNTHLNKNHSHQTKRKFTEPENQKKKKKKRSPEKNQWKMHNETVSYDVESPIPSPSPSPPPWMIPAFGFDDEDDPFISLLDSFAVCDAFGCKI